MAFTVVKYLLQLFGSLLEINYIKWMPFSQALISRRHWYIQFPVPGLFSMGIDITLYFYYRLKLVFPELITL